MVTEMERGKGETEKYRETAMSPAEKLASSGFDPCLSLVEGYGPKFLRIIVDLRPEVCSLRKRIGLGAAAHPPCSSQIFYRVKEEKAVISVALPSPKDQ